MKRIASLLSVLVISLALCAEVFAQANVPLSTATQVQAGQAINYLIPISATAAVNAQTTLTIPAPSAGQYNYVCMLGFNLSHNATGTAATNNVTTSTNFNSFAIKFSSALVVNGNYDWPPMIFGTPATGCAKSTLAGTATTFVSPAALAQSAFTWYATYYQAP